MPGKIFMAMDVHVGFCDCEGDAKRARHFNVWCRACETRSDNRLRETDVPKGVDRDDLDTIVQLVNARLSRERAARRTLTRAIAKTRRAKAPKAAKSA